MKTAPTAAAVMALTLLLIATPTLAPAMSTYKWKNRPLVVFAPSAGSDALARQRAIVAANRTGFRERNMVVVYVRGSSVSAEFGSGPGRSAAALRKRYGVTSSQFRAILVGKDGGTKLSSASPIDAARLFGLIDSMPMRRQEMRK